jgi:lipopolysaccharide export system permease protein
VGAWLRAAVYPAFAGHSEWLAQEDLAMTAILSQYLMRTVLASTMLVLVVLLALAGLFEFIAELDDTQGGYQTPQVILYAALRLPNLAFEMLPVAALIGSLLGLGALAGLVMLIVTGLIGEFIGPPLDLYAREMRLEARSEKGDARLGNETWVKDGPVYLHLERVNSEFEFGSIYLFRFNDDHELAAIARAENSGIDEDDNWILENLRETRFKDGGVQVVKSSVAVESFEVNAELLGSSLSKPLSLSARGLLGYIDYLKRNNLDASQYESELWHRGSRTFTVLIMPILALAFVFGSLRTGGAGGRLMLGVIIGLAYYLGSETLANSGQVFDLNPALMNWLPTLLLCLVTGIALKRIR